MADPSGEKVIVQRFSRFTERVRAGASDSQSQTSAVPDHPAETSFLPSGEKFRDHAVFSVGSVFNSAPLAKSNIKIPEVLPATASLVPLGDKTGSRPSRSKV